jgi:hypothetical protein
MNLKPIHAFLGGVALTALIAAAKFVGGTPLDQTFTYQGQLRNAGQLVNGPVDLKISMWDADTGGSQVGSTNTFNAMQLNDGRFACGLNFGNAAFDGSNRWIQVEFRNPAGSGQYQALSPRDKITATPYALYALNGANGVWVYDTNQQSVSVTGKKVGIGTSNPTAALEVVDATGGDDSVKLPAGSVGVTELAPVLSYVMEPIQMVSGATVTIQIPRAGTLAIDIVSPYSRPTVSVNGIPVTMKAGEARDCCTSGHQTNFTSRGLIDVQPGACTVVVTGVDWYYTSMLHCTLHAGRLSVSNP